MLLETLMSDPNSGQKALPHPPDVVVVVVLDVDVDVGVGGGGGVGGAAAAVVIVVLPLPFQPCDLRSCLRNAPAPASDIAGSE